MYLFLFYFNQRFRYVFMSLNSVHWIMLPKDHHSPLLCVCKWILTNLKLKHKLLMTDICLQWHSNWHSFRITCTCACTILQWNHIYLATITAGVLKSRLDLTTTEVIMADNQSHPFPFCSILHMANDTILLFVKVFKILSNVQAESWVSNSLNLDHKHLAFCDLWHIIIPSFRPCLLSQYKNSIF